METVDISTIAHLVEAILAGVLSAFAPFLAMELKNYLRAHATLLSAQSETLLLGLVQEAAEDAIHMLLLDMTKDAKVSITRDSAIQRSVIWLNTHASETMKRLGVDPNELETIVSDEVDKILRREQVQVVKNTTPPNEPNAPANNNSAPQVTTQVTPNS